MSKLEMDADPIVRQGTVLLPDMIVDYDIRQPAPTQWVAMGIARSVENACPRTSPRLIIGTGASETEAIRDLCLRLMASTVSGSSGRAASGRPSL